MTSEEKRENSLKEFAAVNHITIQKVNMVDQQDSTSPSSAIELPQTSKITTFKKIFLQKNMIEIKSPLSVITLKSCEDYSQKQSTSPSISIKSVNVKNTEEQLSNKDSEKSLRKSSRQNFLKENNLQSLINSQLSENMLQIYESKKQKEQQQQSQKNIIDEESAQSSSKNLKENLISAKNNKRRSSYFQNLQEKEDFQIVLSENSTNENEEQIQKNYSEIDEASSLSPLRKTILKGGYEVLECVGKGMQAIVYKVRELKTNKILIAKVFKNSDEGEVKESIKNEFDILKSLNDPNIIKVYELIDDGNQQTIIMEYFDGQNLNTIGTQSLTNEQIAFIIEKLLNIAIYLHKQNVIHRDIQLRNILLNSTKTDLKLIDFGIAKKVFEDECNFSQCGYKHYRAPEMLNGEVYTDKVDIWQIGQIYYEMMEKTQVSSKKLALSIKKNKVIFKKTPQNVQKVIQQLLVLNHNERPNALQALELIKNLNCFSSN